MSSSAFSTASFSTSLPQQQQSRPASPAPPPPPPSAPLGRSRWPFSGDDLSVFMDPFSSEAADLKTTIQITSQCFGSPFPFATDIPSATHIVLDPRESRNRFLRAVPPPQHVCSLDWLSSSFDQQTAQSEALFSVLTWVDPEEKRPVPPLTHDDDNADADQEQAKQDKGPGDASKFVPTQRTGPDSWLVEEEEEMARFLASNPQTGVWKMWEDYSRSHPSRSNDSYYAHYKKRQHVYFDRKVTELKAANGGQAVAYVHPKVASEDKRPASSSDAASSFSRQVSHHSRTPFVAPSKPPPVLLPGLCANCEVDRASYWYRLTGKGDRRFCGGCRSAWYNAERDTPGTGEKGLAIRRARILGDSSGRSGHKATGLDASEREDGLRPISSLFPSSTAGASGVERWDDADRMELVVALAKYQDRGFDTVTRKFRKHRPSYTDTEVNEHYHQFQEAYDSCAKKERTHGQHSTATVEIPETHETMRRSLYNPKWTKEEDELLVKFLALRKGSKAQAFRDFSNQSPMRTESKVSAHYTNQKTRIDQAVERYLRKTETRATVQDDAPSGSEDSLDSDSSMNEDEEEDIGSVPTPSIPTGAGKRPSEDQQEAGSSKRARVVASESPSERQSSPSLSTSSSPHLHTSDINYRAPGSSRNGIISASPVPDRRDSVASSSSSNPTRPPGTPFLPAPSTPLHDSAPFGTHLEPPSFLALGAPPSSCTGSHPLERWCWWCGDDAAPRYAIIPLAAVNPETKVAERIEGKLGCEECEKSWERRVVRGLKLPEEVKEMGDLERLAWVTGVLDEKGRELRWESVYGREE